MYEAIKICKPGTKFYEIGDVIQYFLLKFLLNTKNREYSNKKGYYACDTFGGHGIGEDMHMPPIIFHNRIMTGI